jgi:predicted nucleic acid-binding protein
MRILLDTSVLLGPAPDFGDADIAISAVSLAELHFGVLAAHTPEVRAERLRRLGVIENTFDALPLDDAVARSYASLAAAVLAADTKPRARIADLLVAATARAHDAQIWTRNADVLRGLESMVTIRAVPE